MSPVAYDTTSGNLLLTRALLTKSTYELGATLLHFLKKRHFVQVLHILILECLESSLDSQNIVSWMIFG